MSDSDGESDNSDVEDDAENEMDVDDEEESDPRGNSVAPTCENNASFANFVGEREVPVNVEPGNSDLGQTSLISDGGVSVSLQWISTYQR